jgi:hypothetical protein
LLKKKDREKNQNKTKPTNFIFINRSRMGEVSILSIPDLNLLFTFTTIKTDGDVANYNLFESIREVVNPMPACAGRVKPKTLK